MKSLTLVYEWIGPHGPISNSRIANYADFYHRSTGEEIVSQGLDPFYYFLRNNTDCKINLKTPIMLEDNEIFLYELEMHFTRDWYSNFFIGKGIFENSKISDDIKNRVMNKTGYLMFTTPMESFVDDHMFHLMTEYFNYYKIPLSQIIYATNSPNADTLYKNFCARKNIEPLMNCAYIGMYERLLISDTKNSSVLMNNTYKVESKQKTFLNFNRRYRNQRFWFLLEIYKRHLLDEFYISFDKTQPEGNLPFLPKAKEINQSMGVNLSIEQLEELNEKLPLVLDSENFSVFPMENALSDTLPFYKNSLIHVVTETEFFTDIIHVSEKTFKPIMYKQPFIFLGPPYILKFLQDSGYKTFNNFWDESYDNITDHHSRMLAILELIESLSKLSDIGKLELSNHMQDIVEFNFNKFVTQTPTMLYDFIEKYGT